MRVIQTHLVSSNPQDTGFNLAVPIPQVPLAISSGTLSGSFTAPPQYVLHMYDMNYQVITAGTVTGTITINQSNDSDQQYLHGTASPYGVTNWAPVPGTTVALTGSTDFTVSLTQQAMKFLQFQYAHTLGTGSIDVKFVGKGAGI